MTCGRPDLQGEQEAAVESLRAWALEAKGGRRPAPEAAALRGLAGTGKTVAAAELVARLAADGARVAVVAPTGRAASVLRRKGVGEATTVHAAAYRLVGEDDAGGLSFKPRRDIAAPLVGLDDRRPRRFTHAAYRPHAVRARTAPRRVRSRGMPTTDALDLAPDTSTGEISDCPPPPDCDDGAALVGVLDDLDIADAATGPAAIAPAAAAILLWWYLRRRRKLAAKPPQGA